MLDEPTTGLDVTTQAHVLATVRELCRSHETAAVYVSHDLAAVAASPQRVLVMYAGRIVEGGPTHELFDAPAHPYTRKLIGAIPDSRAAAARGDPRPGARDRAAAPPAASSRLAAPTRHACVRGEPPPLVELGAGHARAASASASSAAAALDRRCRRRRSAAAAAAALLEVQRLNAFHGAARCCTASRSSSRPRECLALVGESGSGKTTLARAIIGLHPPRSGEIRLDGTAARRPARDARQGVLPRHPVRLPEPDELAQPAAHDRRDPRHAGRALLRPAGGAAADARVAELLERVSLPAPRRRRYPGELSGGERQRVSIARALAASRTS